MRTLKSMLNKYMYTITGILIGALLIIVFIIQIFSEQQNGYRDAVRIFKQMEHLLHENEEELEETIKRHNAMCLNEASAIARLLEANPDGINDVNYLILITITVILSLQSTFSIANDIILFGTSFNSFCSIIVNASSGWITSQIPSLQTIISSPDCTSITLLTYGVAIIPVFSDLTK